MSMIRNITIKLASMPVVTKTDTEVHDPELFDAIADLYVPLGFYDSKEMLMPVSRIILQWAMSEHLASFSNPAKDTGLKNLILMLAFWLRHPLMTDSFFCQNVIEAIWFFLKSGKRNLTQKSLPNH